MSISHVHLPYFVLVSSTPFKFPFVRHFVLTEPSCFQYKRALLLELSPHASLVTEFHLDKSLFYYCITCLLRVLFTVCTSLLIHTTNTAKKHTRDNYKTTPQDTSKNHPSLTHSPTQQKESHKGPLGMFYMFHLTISAYCLYLNVCLHVCP